MKTLQAVIYENTPVDQRLDKIIVTTLSKANLYEMMITTNIMNKHKEIDYLYYTLEIEEEDDLK